MVESTDQPIPVAETPPAEQAPPVEAMKPFDPIQQAKLESLIKKAKSEAARDLRREHAILLQENAEMKASMRLPADTAEQVAAARAELSAAKQELTKIDAQTKAQNKKAALQAAAHEFFDPQIAATCLAQYVQYQGDALVVLGKDGEPRLGSDGEAFSLKDLAEEWGNSHKYMVRSSFVGGSGSVAGGGPRETGPKLSEIFGKDSDGAMANQLSLRNPAEYRRLRVRAVAAGLLSR